MAESLYDHNLDAVPSTTKKGSGELPYPGGPGRVDDNGKCELRPDPKARGRSIRDALKFLLFAAFLVPLLLYASLSVGLGIVGVESCVVIGFCALILAPVYALWRIRFYRCPQCDRRLKHIPQEDRTANILEHCPDCRIIWDLGFGWVSNGEGGD